MHETLSTKEEMKWQDFALSNPQRQKIFS